MMREQTAPEAVANCRGELPSFAFVFRAVDMRQILSGIPAENVVRSNQ